MEFDNSRPIWQQLVAEFGRLVVTGNWPAGGRIASVRDLAVTFGVNPNTIQRALTEFERLGLARTERTAGRFVTTNEALIDEYRSQLAGEIADGFIDQVQGLSMTLDQASTLIQQRWTERRQ